MFRRIHWNNRGCKSIVWRCISRLEPTGQECHARTVNETVLENVVVQAINTLLGDKSTYQAQLQQNIAKVIVRTPVSFFFVLINGMEFAIDGREYSDGRKFKTREY